MSCNSCEWSHTYIEHDQPDRTGVVRSWTKIDDFARIYGGVHYRNSTQVGTAMGKKIGALAAANAFQPAK